MFAKKREKILHDPTGDFFSRMAVLNVENLQ